MLEPVAKSDDINSKMKGVLNTSWDDIEEVEPDEIDLQMLKAIEEDPECHIFTKESEINWDE